MPVKCAKAAESRWEVDVRETSVVDLSERSPSALVELPCRADLLREGGIAGDLLNGGHGV